MRKVLFVFVMVLFLGASLFLFQGGVAADEAVTAASVMDHVDVEGFSVLPPVSPVTEFSVSDSTITTTMVVTWYTYLPWISSNWPPIPKVPELYPLEQDVVSKAYTVTWSVARSKDPVLYTLQEARQPDFSDAVEYTTTLTTTVVTGHQWGTYYYRVRGTNKWGDSVWSNVQSIVVYSFYDSFNSPDTGWRTRRTSSPDLGLIRAFYQDGDLITHVNDRFDFGIFSPMRKAPPPPYRLMLRSKIIHKANETSYGMVFGGNGGSLCPVDRETGGDRSGCFYRYYRLNVIWGGYLKFDVKRIDFHENEKGNGRGVELIGTRSLESYKAHADGWNDWQIRVYEDGFVVYVNNSKLGWTYDTRFINNPYYGIFSSNYEYNGARFQHAYFYVEPIPPDGVKMMALPSPDEGYRLPGTSWYVPLEEADVWLDNAVEEDLLPLHVVDSE